MDTRKYLGPLRGIFVPCCLLFMLLNPVSAQSQVDDDKGVVIIENPLVGEAAVLGDAIYVIAGAPFGHEPPQTDVVYRSTNGIDFQMIATETPWESFASGSSLDAFNGLLWRINSIRSNGSIGHCEVWSSPDGVNWTLEVPITPFIERTNHATVVHNGKLYVIGGLINSTYESVLHDIWATSNGVHWELINPSPQFDERGGHQVVSHNGQMWLIGGNNGVSTKHDIWSSVDGIQWTSHKNAAYFYARADHQLFVYDNKIWMVGGGFPRINAVHSDVWSSPDGTTWSRVTENTTMNRIVNHSAVVFNNKMVIIGGSEFEDFDAVYSSTDGITWVDERTNQAKAAVDKWNSFE